MSGEPVKKRGKAMPDPSSWRGSATGRDHDGDIAIAHLSDADLLEGVRDGCQEAWNELVGRYSPRLWTIARSYVLDADLSADVVQGTWLQLLDGAHLIRQPSSVGAWLKAVTKHEALRLVRARRRDVEKGTRAAGRDAVAAPPADDGLDRGDDLTRLQMAVTRLDERAQMLLHLLFSDAQLSYDEIGELMDMPVGSIGPTRGRVLERVRALLSELERLNADACGA